MLLLTVTEFRNNISKYLQLAFTEKVALKSKRGVIELTPSREIRLNPSPSGDPWFEDSRNLAELDRATDELRTGKVEPKELSDEQLKDIMNS
jgi:hypothetical protein